MKTKEITIAGVPTLVTLGDHVSGRGHSLTYRHGRNVRAHFIKGFTVSDADKSITAHVVEVELDTDQLKPLPEYFAPGTNVLTVEEKLIKEYPNKSKGPRYSHFYALASQGLAGDILYRNALLLHVLENFKTPEGQPGPVIINPEGEIIQPPIPVE